MEDTQKNLFSSTVSEALRSTQSFLAFETLSVTHILALRRKRDRSTESTVGAEDQTHTPYAFEVSYVFEVMGVGRSAHLRLALGRSPGLNTH